MGSRVHCCELDTEAVSSKQKRLQDVSPGVYSGLVSVITSSWENNMNVCVVVAPNILHGSCGCLCQGDTWPSRLNERLRAAGD